MLPEGRITPQDTGLWTDSQIAPLKSIVDFAHSQSQKVGIQLGHAGRKASTIAPWLSGATVATEVVGGWPEGVYAPSAIQWAPEYAQPKEASVEYIKTVVGAFAASAKRAVEAGIDVIEIRASLFTFAHPTSVSTLLYRQRSRVSFIIVLEPYQQQAHGQLRWKLREPYSPDARNR